jgi:hypothetical protein
VDMSQFEHNDSDPEEMDYLRIVWSPIFELLFSKDSPIIVKTYVTSYSRYTKYLQILHPLSGETTNKESTLNKTEQYCMDKEAIAFKIDV